MIIVNCKYFNFLIMVVVLGLDTCSTVQMPLHAWVNFNLKWVWLIKGVWFPKNLARYAGLALPLHSSLLRA